MVPWYDGQAIKSAIRIGEVVRGTFHDVNQRSDFASSLPLVLLQTGRNASAADACVSPVDPVVKVPTVVVVADANRTHGLAGLNGWTAAGQPGATEYYAGIEIRGYSSMNSCVLARRTEHECTGCSLVGQAGLVALSSGRLGLAWLRAQP